jgi:glyoxylate/succinic semialdehyde reductase
MAFTETTSVACFACNPILQCDELVEHGASIGETPAAVAKKCKCIIAMLSDPSAALSVGVFHVGIWYFISLVLVLCLQGHKPVIVQVVFDKDGVLEQICHGKGYIDMSTVDADTSLKISEVWLLILLSTPFPFISLLWIHSG